MQVSPNVHRWHVSQSCGHHSLILGVVLGGIGDHANGRRGLTFRPSATLTCSPLGLWAGPGPEKGQTSFLGSNKASDLSSSSPAKGQEFPAPHLVLRTLRAGPGEPPPFHFR